MKTTLLATHFNIYLNLEASLHSITTVICINPYSPNKLIATKCCFLIPGDDTSFFFLTLLLIFTKIIIFLINFFFHENCLYFFMFRDVPGCSGMFRHVPECSVFLVLLYPSPESQVKFKTRRDGWNSS